MKDRWIDLKDQQRLKQEGRAVEERKSRAVKNGRTERGRKGGVVEDIERTGGMFLEHNEDQYHSLIYGLESCKGTKTDTMKQDMNCRCDIHCYHGG